MGTTTAFIDLNTSQGIGILVSIIFGSFSVVFGLFNVANFFAARRERKLKTYETTPEVRAVINRKLYDGGWRSVQLHISAPAEKQNFEVRNWRIDHARLLRLWSRAVLARAENDDYATAVFYPDNPIRALDGKADGRPQLFALEFFIHFKKEDDRGSTAKFKVSFSHKDKRRRYSMRVMAAVPANAEYAAPAKVADQASLAGA